MPLIAKLFLIFQGLLVTGGLILLIYFIIRRINLKQKEDFEKRDN